MGACISSGSPKLFADAVRRSLFGFWLSDEEIVDFCMACKVEKLGKKPQVLNLSQDNSFYIVVSGEIQALLRSSTTSDSHLVVSYGFGEALLLLPTHQEPTMEFEGKQLIFQAISKAESPIVLLSMRREVLKGFLEKRPHLDQLAQLCIYLDISEKMCDSPVFKKFKPERVHQLLSVMKFSFCKSGQIVRQDAPSTGEDPIVPAKAMGLLIQGSCVYTSDIMETRARIKQSSSDDSGSTRRNTLYAASSTSLIAHLPTSALDVMMQAYPSVRRKMRGNYYHHILEGIREAIPLLNDVDDRVFSTLCEKIAFRGYRANEEIFKAGAPSDYSYICIHGSIQETVYIHQLEDKTSTNKSVVQSMYADAQTEVRVLGPLALFGEVSLLTGMPYFSSTIALEATVVICISKRTLDLLYSQDGAKLSSLRLRLTSPDQVPLSLVLQHPEGNKVFSRFLQSQHCEESLRFYNATSHFRSLADTLLRRLRDCGAEALEALRDYCLDQLCDPTALGNASPLVPETESSLDESSRLASKGAEDGLLTSSFSTVTTSSIFVSALGIPPPLVASPSTSAMSQSIGVSRSLSFVPSAAKQTLESWRYTHSSSVQIQEGLLAVLRDLRNLSVHICRQYIESGSAMEVNISHGSRERSLASHRAFIQQNIYGCMASFVSDMLDARALDDQQRAQRRSLIGTISEEEEEEGDEDEAQCEQEALVKPEQTQPNTPLPQARHPTASTVTHALQEVRLKVGGEDISAIFQEAQQEIYQLMLSDGFPRFSLSPEFQAFLKAYHPQLAGSGTSKANSSVEPSGASNGRNISTRHSVFGALPFAGNFRISLRGSGGGGGSTRRQTSPKEGSDIDALSVCSQTLALMGDPDGADDDPLATGLFVTSTGSERRHRPTTLYVEGRNGTLPVRRSARYIHPEG